MQMLPIIHNLDAWDRKGRGNVYQFFVTDNELLDVLHNSLPEEYSPYSLVCYDVKKEGKVYIQKGSVFPLNDFIDLRNKGQWEFFLWSSVLCPEEDITQFDDIVRFCALNGCVNIQHGMERKGKRCDSSIGVVDRVVELATGKTYKHEIPTAIFNAIMNQIKKFVSITSVWVRPDGKREESKSILMSEAFVNECRHGSICPEREVGRKIGSKFSFLFRY